MKKLVLILSIISLISCKDEGECNDCDKALQHMAGKISGQFCNPISMASAWSRITDDCGKTYDDNYVGYMAETCNLGSVKTPTCGHSLNTYSFREQLKINYSYSLGLPDDTVVVIITFDSETKQMDQQIIVNQSISTPFPFELYDGNLLEVTLVHFVTGDTLAEDMVRFTFDRYDNWKYERNIDVQYDQQTQQYTMTLNNWGDR